MLPYFSQPELHLGPLRIHAFGVLVACGILLGLTILRRRAALEGLPANEVTRFVTWTLVGGFLGAHLVDRFVYFSTETFDDLWSIFHLWEGLSSFGGFLGGTAAAILFLYRHAAAGTAWKYVDAFAYAFPFGWVFGRLGCFVAYDHPGTPTASILGQVYKDGIVRHNLGLEEALYTILIAAAFAALGRRRRGPGFFLAVFLVAYAPFRFALDSLRLVDVRYFGLTPAQYGCVVLGAMGMTIVLRLQITRDDGV